MHDETPPAPLAEMLSGLAVTPSDGTRYRAVRLHAQGGLGEVHVAEDSELGRAVALKRVRSDRQADPESLRRFVLEAEITARLEHPGIVPVYGLVRHADGQPAYAMRFVQGDTLKEAIHRYHAAPTPLGFRRLLGSFVAACQAVAYAHDRGVIHRDLKPSNILVGKFGETLVVDWGLAKVVGRVEPSKADLEGTLTTAQESGGGDATAMGQAVGTPQYMSPEQAAGRWNVVGPATDVYGLGAVLYHLLTDRPPIEGADRHEVLAKVQRGAFLPPHEVNRAVPKALDAVVRKALALEPQDRYATATALAEDVEHWLADEPVGALKESLAVRARRWARKHPGPAVGLAAALLVGLLSLAVGAVLLEGKNRELRHLNTDLAASNRSLDGANASLTQTNEQLDTANQGLKAANAAITEARDKAEEQRQVAHAVRDFLQHKLLGQADTRTQADALLRAGGLAAVAHAKQNPRIRELLDRATGELAADKIEANFPKQPLLQAELLQTVGGTYLGLGEFAVGVALLERSAGLCKERLGPGHPGTLATLHTLAVAYREAGKVSEAIQLFEQVQAAREAQFGFNHLDTLNTLNGLALVYRDAGRLQEALAHFERVRAACEAKLGPDNPATLTALSNLALVYQDTGKQREALAVFERVRVAREVQLGPNHPDTLTTLHSLAVTYDHVGRRPEALRLYERVRAAQEAKLGPDHPDTLTTLNSLAAAYWSAKRLDRSIPLFEDALKRWGKKLGRDHPDTLVTVANLGVNYRDAGRLREAIPLLEEAHRKGRPYARLVWVTNVLLDAYAEAGQDTEATLVVRELVASARKSHKPESPELAGVLAPYARRLLNLRRHDEAEPLLRECLAIREKTQPDAWTTYSARSLLGGALARRKRYAEAEPLLVQGYEGMKAREATIPAQGKGNLREALERLVGLYEAQGKTAEAAKWRAELAARKERDAKPKP